MLLMAKGKDKSEKNMLNKCSSIPRSDSFLNRGFVPNNKCNTDICKKILFLNTIYFYFFLENDNFQF